MNFENIITVFLSATIPSFITYLITKKNCESKINEVNISSNAQIEQLKMQHQHEIDTLNSEHQHLIEKLEIEYKLQKEIKSDDMSTQMAMKFFTGELDLNNVLNGMGNLEKLTKETAKLKKQKDMSNFVKKK